ncbi:MAG: trypsin-like serine protease [bacterium]
MRRFTVHPGFRPDGGDGQFDAAGVGREDDIAVIVLEQPVADQAPTPILPAGLVDRLSPGLMLTIAGYGVTDLERAQRSLGHAAHRRDAPHPPGGVRAAGGRPGDTCNGDSGGPAYATIDGTRYLVGATSRGADDARVDCGDRGIYTLVPAYADWVAQVVGNPNENNPVEPPAVDPRPVGLTTRPTARSGSTLAPRRGGTATGSAMTSATGPIPTARAGGRRGGRRGRRRRLGRRRVRRRRVGRRRVR